MHHETNPPESDELELLRKEAEALGMPGPITYESAGLKPLSAEDMLARVKSRSAAVQETTDTSQRRQPRRKFSLSAAGLAAASVGVVMLIIAPWQQERALAITPPVLDYEFANARNIAYAPGVPARVELLRLAEAANTAGTETGAGQTQYVLTDNWFATLESTKAAKLVPTIRQSWFRANGTIRVREQTGVPLSPDGRGVTGKADGSSRAPVNETYPPSNIDPAFIRNLDSEPLKARAALLEAGECEDRSAGQSRASCLFQQVSTLFTQYVVPPTAAATLWRVLAAEPELRLLGAVTDRAGRPGVGISIVPTGSPNFRKILIISPRTGELLGTEDILIKDDPSVGVEAPAIYSFTAYLDSRFTRRSGPPD